MPEPAEKPKAARSRKSNKDEAHLSTVLKSVYQKAVDEDIPSEMLDLLRKLD